MAQIIWAEPVLIDLNKFAEYVVLSNPIATSHLVMFRYNRLTTHQPTIQK